MRKSILPSIVSLALITLLIFPLGQHHLENNSCDQAIKTLESKNKALENENLRLDEKIKTLKHQADSLMQKADHEKEQVVKLKKRRNEKIHAIDSYAIDELVSFFTNLEADSASVSQ